MITIILPSQNLKLPYLKKITVFGLLLPFHRIFWEMKLQHKIWKKKNRYFYKQRGIQKPQFLSFAFFGSIVSKKYNIETVLSNHFFLQKLRIEYRLFWISLLKWKLSVKFWSHERIVNFMQNLLVWVKGVRTRYHI